MSEAWATKKLLGEKFYYDKTLDVSTVLYISYHNKIMDFSTAEASSALEPYNEAPDGSTVI